MEDMMRSGNPARDVYQPSGKGPPDKTGDVIEWEPVPDYVDDGGKPTKYQNIEATGRGSGTYYYDTTNLTREQAEKRFKQKTYWDKKEQESKNRVFHARLEINKLQEKNDALEKSIFTYRNVLAGRAPKVTVAGPDGFVYRKYFPVIKKYRALIEKSREQIYNNRLRIIQITKQTWDIEYDPPQKPVPYIYDRDDTEIDPGYLPTDKGNPQAQIKRPGYSPTDKQKTPQAFNRYGQSLRV